MFISKLRDEVQTAENPTRCPYVCLSFPWHQSSSTFIYGSDDSLIMPICSDNLPCKRDILGSGYKMCCTILVAFYPFESFTREIPHRSLRAEINDNGNFLAFFARKYTTSYIDRCPKNSKLLFYSAVKHKLLLFSSASNEH